jgi:hypothetical protein
LRPLCSISAPRSHVRSAGRRRDRPRCEPLCSNERRFIGIATTAPTAHSASKAPTLLAHLLGDRAAHDAVTVLAGPEPQRVQSAGYEQGVVLGRGWRRARRCRRDRGTERSDARRQDRRPAARRMGSTAASRPGLLPRDRPPGPVRTSARTPYARAYFPASRGVELPPGGALTRGRPRLAAELELDVDHPSNVLAGARYLKYLINRYHRTDLALARTTPARRRSTAPVARRTPRRRRHVANVQRRRAALAGCA